MTTDLALTRPDATLTMDVLRAQMEAAKRYVDSGLLPSGIRTPQQALTIMQVGREIGVPATYALRNIHVIEGKPACSAELLMALVRRHYGQGAIRVKEATGEGCTVEYREQGWDGVSSLTFTLADARLADLATRPMWKKYPRAMLRSRAVSECVRTAFPECIAGLYTPEELGAEVRVADDGSVELARAREHLAIVDAMDVPRAPTDEEREAWRRAWHASVRGTSLAHDDDRHRFFRQWTRGRTESSADFFATATASQADECLAHTRVLADEERAAIEAASGPDDDEPGAEERPF